MKKIPSLDGLRAISILIVLIGHARFSPGVPEWLTNALRLAINEELGVYIFFVISGFLITHLLLSEKTEFRQIDIKKFYIRRALRILPVAYIYIFFIWLINHKYSLGIRNDLFVHAATYTTNFVVMGTWLLGHLWSLGVEEQFYLIWPWVVRKNLKTIIYLSLAIIFYAPVSRFIFDAFPEYRIMFLCPFFNYADSLMIGALLGISWHAQSKIWNSSLVMNRFFFCFCFALMWMASLLDYSQNFRLIAFPFGRTVIGICAAFIIMRAISVKEGWIYGFLNHPFVSYIGVLSYSIYIWQQFFFFKKSFPDADVWWRAFPFNFIVAFLVATASYYCWEKFFLKLKTYFKVV